MNTNFIWNLKVQFYFPVVRFINNIRWALSDRDKSIILEATYQQCADWWLELNEWGWPKELLPKDSDQPVTGGRRYLLRAFINQKVGHKYILRRGNKDMTEDEFEDFWQMHNDEAAYKRWAGRVDRINSDSSQSHSPVPRQAPPLEHVTLRS